MSGTNSKAARGTSRPAAHQKREMRMEIIRSRTTHDKWTSCCVTMAWSLGRARGRAHLGTSFLPLLTQRVCTLRASVKVKSLTDSRPLSSIVEPRPVCPVDVLVRGAAAHEKLVHCTGSAIPSVRKSLPTIKTDETLKGLARYFSTSPRLLWCHPQQPMPSKIGRSSDANKQRAL